VKVNRHWDCILLKWGAVEIQRLSPIGQSLIVSASAVAFGYVSLLAQSRQRRNTRRQAIARSREIWFLPQASVAAAVTQQITRD